MLFFIVFDNFSHLANYLNCFVSNLLIVVVKKFIKNWECCLSNAFVSIVAEFVRKKFDERLELVQQSFLDLSIVHGEFLETWHESIDDASIISFTNKSHKTVGEVESISRRHVT